MKEIEIKDISGKTRFSTPINKGAKGKFTLMKEDYIILPFSVKEPVYFKLGDYVDLSGALDDSLGGLLSKVYEIVDLQKPTFNTSTGGYDYQLRMDAYYWKWKNKIFKYTPEHAGHEASWSLTATLDVQLGVFLRNLKALGYTHKGTDFTFEIDSTVENKAIAMTYDNTNLLDALFSMASKDKWNCDCWITDNIIHFGRNEYGDAVKIELGVEASAMTHSESKGTYATRIYAFGATRNIPENYRPVDEQAVVNGVVQKRLMLPSDTPYIDAYEGMSQEEAIEDIVVFDDLYPRRVGTLSDVHTRTEDVENEDGTKETVTYYRYKDTGLEFKEEYIIEGQELEIIFQSGRMNGMKFGVIFNPKPEDSGRGKQLWEIVRNEDYGRMLPDDTIYPENEDKYILSGFNIQMVSDQYIPDAEKELKEKAQKYADQRKKDDGTYNTTLDSVWVYGDKLKRFYEFGQKINLVNKAFFENGRESRVLGWEFNLDIPWDSPTYVIGESMPYSRIGDIEEQIDSLTYKGQTYTGSGGCSIYVIKTNDSTAPSDSNVFSAKRTLATLLRKDKEDETKYLLKLLGGVIAPFIQSPDFISGPMGTGFTLKRNADGTTYAEVDKLLVRMKAVFQTLSIMETELAGASFLFNASGARIKVTKVERLENTFRCHYLADDGDAAIENRFRIGNLARSQTFNIKPGVHGNVSNHYYWRKVENVGDDYIDLSITHCDADSDEPQEGDVIVQFGDIEDPDYQSAIVLSAYGDSAPYITMYQSINSYTLGGKDVFSIGHDRRKQECFLFNYGSAYIGNRKRDSYMSFSPDEGVDIAGKVKMAAGSSGASHLTDLPDEVYKAVQIGGENLLHNTSFVGDYKPVSLEKSTRLKKGTELYSPDLKGWDGTGNVTEEPASVSGHACSQPNLSQEISLIPGETYMVGYKAKGTSVRLEIGDTQVMQELTSEYGTYYHRLVFDSGNRFSVSGDCTVCEIKLERGTVATDWCPSRDDTDPVAEGFKGLWYLQEAMKGNSQTIGGLSLLTMIQLGKWVDGVMEKVNAGVSGIYNEDTDVAFWAGGTFEEAIATVTRLSLGEQLTDGEWKKLAKFVVTHGGNVFLRGYVYALGGYFRGLIDLGNGVTRFNADGTGWIGKKGSSRPFFDFSGDTLYINGILHSGRGSSLGGLTVTESGALIGYNMTVASVMTGFNQIPGSGAIKDYIRNFIVDNIGRAQIYDLTFNGEGLKGAYTVLLPDYNHIRAKIPELSSGAYGFALSFIVSPAIYFTGIGGEEITTVNEAHFSLQPSSGARLYDNNGNRIDSIEMERGDFLELLCIFKRDPFNMTLTTAEYFIKVLKQ